MKNLLVIVIFIAVLGSGLLLANLNQSKEDLIEDAYIYGYPLVLMDVTKEVMTATDHPTSRKAPINQFAHLREFPNPDFKDIVSPNADTLYSIAWLDLSKEPIILKVPKIEDRYYVFPVYDAWTNVFKSIGPRTTGDDKGNYALVGPEWKGTFPSGVKPIRSPTNLVWIIGRIETRGSKDYAAVHEIQDQFELVPLSSWGKEFHPPASVPFNKNTNLTAPVKQVENMSSEIFFERLSYLLKENPPSLEDAPFIERLKEARIFPDFNVSNDLTTEDSVYRAKTKIKNYFDTSSIGRHENGWLVITEKMGKYGTDYNMRAATAYGGLGANLSEDAVYPYGTLDAKGKPLNGSNSYVLHFEKGKLPPAKAFWSITLYNDHHFFVSNPINRYALGDRDDLKFNEDGSLDILIQKDRPKETSNWLPSPQGNFNLIMRIYEPESSVLSGEWKPPFIQKVNR